MAKKEPLFAEERKMKILELLNENSKIIVPELCEYFGVSPATIRNDLRELENSGLLKRTHGGAIKNLQTRYELDTIQKQIKNLPEKQAIAKRAVELVEDGDTIAIDTGTTTLEFAKLLSSRKGITVVVNDIKIASYLEYNTDANIILIGGMIRRHYNCTVGHMAINALKGLNVDKAFMATNGLSIKRGLTTPDMSQAEVKRAMMDIASEIIVLCDSSKIENMAFVQFAPIDRVDRLITDDKIDDRDLNEFKMLGIEVDVVEVEV
jgi:DeoR family fructose operon transcriptional repressor